MNRWWLGSALAFLFLAYPLVAHLLAARGGGGVIPWIIAIWLLWRSWHGKGTMRWLLLGLALALAGGNWLIGAMVVRWVPVVAFLFVAFVFGRTLVHPPPLIERMVRLQYRDIPPYLLTYLRSLTWIWTVFFLLLAGISALLTLTEAKNGWLWFHGVVIYMAMGGLVWGEYVFRRWRFHELGEIPPPHVTFREIIRHGRHLWQE